MERGIVIGSIAKADCDHFHCRTRSISHGRSHPYSGDRGSIDATGFISIRVRKYGERKTRDGETLTRAQGSSISHTLELPVPVTSGRAQPPPPLQPPPPPRPLGQPANSSADTDDPDVSPAAPTDGQATSSSALSPEGPSYSALALQGGGAQPLGVDERTRPVPGVGADMTESSGEVRWGVQRTQYLGA
ncbi:hypothetical protein HJFPF1_05641 [Paramyrothecium foliicola]|nr:hypothetical protein HJFPF1_05641 [Paramyrothecium foliicola]